MYRGGPRPCPACATPTLSIHLEDPEPSTVEVCPRCQGVFVEFFDGELAAVARAVVRRRREARMPEDSALLPTPDQDEKTPTCPECDHAMALRLYLDRGPNLFRCGVYMSAFLRRDQLHDLARFGFV